MKRGGVTGNEGLGRATGGRDRRRGEQYLVQRKAEKLLEQRREGGDGGRARRGCLGSTEMAAVYQASRDGVQACIGRSLESWARRTTDGSRSKQKRKNMERVRRRRRVKSW